MKEGMKMKMEKRERYDKREDIYGVLRKKDGGGDDMW